MADKISELRAELEKHQTAGVVLSALDEIACTLECIHVLYYPRTCPF